MPFRLAKDHMQRLEKAAEACGQTKSAFITAAVLAEVAEVEERIRMKRSSAIRNSNLPISAEATSEIDSDSSPIGTSIIGSLRKQQEINQPIQPTNTQGQVVVNVGNNSSGPQSIDLIEKLSAYVLTGNDFERSTRMRTAVSVLHASTSTDEERKVLAARLDEAIATKSKSPIGGTGSVTTRVTRMAFDKLAGILGDK